MLQVSTPGHQVLIPPLGLVGEFAGADDARAVVVFAHGCGSSHKSPRNRAVAADLRQDGFATLLLDLLLPEECDDHRKMFDAVLLSGRVLHALSWLAGCHAAGRRPMGLFGASTGAAAALVAATRARGQVGALVARGGRPDLVLPALALVRAPTLLLVGGADAEVLELNRRAMARFGGPVALDVIPGAHHLFEEDGALHQVSRRASSWLSQHLCGDPPAV